VNATASSTQRRVLALLPGVPLPANTGGALRALTMVRAEVEILCRKFPLYPES